MSDFFDVTLRIKQCEPLSPILLILFINHSDIVDNIDFSSLTENDVNMLTIYLILFADDFVLFTTDAASLQSQINELAKYSGSWDLKINVKKNKFGFLKKESKINMTNF